jgi:hypothetical protein
MRYISGRLRKPSHAAFITNTTFLFGNFIKGNNVGDADIGQRMLLQ